MNTYTVVGYYADNNQPFVTTTTAEDWKSAINNTMQDADSSLVVVAVLHGVCTVADGLQITVDATDAEIINPNKETQP